MKLIILLCFSLLILNVFTFRKSTKSTKSYKFQKSHLKHKNHHKGPEVANIDLVGKDEVPHIPFDPSATEIEEDINSVGEKVDDNVYLKEFPFKVTRCDEVVFFPSAFVNNADDFRVRKQGFVGITAHFTNLYYGKDGQKLIQQVIHTKMRHFPKLVEGAAGCFKVFGDAGQKDMIICVASIDNALNIIETYKVFARCAMGDNLSKIPTRQLNKLMGLCGANPANLIESPHTLVAGDINNTGKGEEGDQLFKPNKHKMRKFIRSKKLRVRKPEFEYPKEKNNKWEQDRLQYFMPLPLRVPGSRREMSLPAGIRPGLNPIDNPGVAPPLVEHRRRLRLFR